MDLFVLWNVTVLTGCQLWCGTAPLFGFRIVRAEIDILSRSDIPSRRSVWHGEHVTLHDEFSLGRKELLCVKRPCEGWKCHDETGNPRNVSEEVHSDTVFKEV